MKCPPHIANPEQTVPQQYIVKVIKDDKITPVFHIEKTCRICKLPIIVLTEKLNKIIADDGWEIYIEEVNNL